MHKSYFLTAKFIKEAKMKKLLLFFVVLFVFSTMQAKSHVNTEIGSGIDLMETVKEHRNVLQEDGSISTVIWEKSFSEFNVQAKVVIKTTRDGDDWEDDFTTTLESNVSNDDVGFYLDQSFPDTPEGDYGALDDSEENCDDSEIFWWGDEIYNYNQNTMDAEYPLVSAWKEGVDYGVDYSLTTSMELDYDFQDTFIVQWRFTITYDGEVYDIIPTSSNCDGYDQQGWPVYGGYFDLRPNLVISDLELRHSDDNSEVTSSNPAVEDEDLYIKVWVEENEGFWAGDDIVIEYYQDNDDFDNDETEEIDANEEDSEVSDDFDFNSTGNHSIRVVIDVDEDVNETDEDDNEFFLEFNVQNAPSPPTVTITDVNKTNWNDVMIYWTGSDPDGGQLQYRYKKDSDSWSGWGLSTQKTYNNLSSGNHNFYVEVKDPTDLTDSDNQSFNIDSEVVISSINDQEIDYGGTLSFDISVSGGSGDYNYSANYGTIDSDGHYTWTPAYNPNPYDVTITAQCQEFPSNYNTEGFQLSIVLPEVVIANLESNYTSDESESFSQTGITASGGNGVDYSWILNSNTTGGNWLGLTNYTSLNTGLQGVCPFVSEETTYDYTLECTSLTNTSSTDFSVTVNNIEVIVEAEYEVINVIFGNNIEDFTVTASGLEEGQYVWGIGIPPASNNGNTTWYDLTIPAGVHGSSITVSGSVNSGLDLPIYACKYDAWQIQGVDNVEINAYPQVSFVYQNQYIFYQNQTAQIQLNAVGGDNQNYVWSANNEVLTLDSANGNSAWFDVDTGVAGNYQVNVTCAQEGFEENQQTTQINIVIQGLNWDVTPMELLFPAEKCTLSIEISNITVNGEGFSYYVTLDNSSYYDILSPMSGYLESGETDVLEISNYENMEPYELGSLLTIHLGSGNDVVIVNLSTEPGYMSLLSFSLPGNEEDSQPLTIWNITDSEQNISLSHSNDLFTISEDELVLGVDESATVYISADQVGSDEYDDLTISSADINYEMPMRKLANYGDYNFQDDGVADSEFISTECLLNHFTIDSELSGMEVFLSQNYQNFKWVIFDDDFNLLYEMNDVSEYMGWQQLNLTEVLEAGNYYLGITGIEENDEVFVGFDELEETVSSYEWDGENLTNLEGILFVRAIVSNPIAYGDIDDNGEVEAYDACLVLMYLVEMIEEIDEERADVNLDGEIMSLDASYILQYVVGIIDEFPVLSRELSNPIISLSNDDNYLYLSSETEVFGLYCNVIDLGNVEIGNVEVNDKHCLFRQNGQEFALASAEGISGEILRIPLSVMSENSNIILDIKSNGFSERLDYRFSIPMYTNLSHNYPNPFNPETSINFTIAEAGEVKIEIYNIKGQKIETLVNENMKSGQHKVVWDGMDCPSGIYFYKMKFGRYTSTKKMILMK